jgi:hypothetical protein
VAAAHAPPPATHPLLQCSRRFVDYLIQQKEPSFTLLLVQSGSVPKAIEFILTPQPTWLPRDLSLSRLGGALGSR